MGSSSPVIDTPRSGLFNYDKEKEKVYLNSIGKIDFKELIMESLSPEFLKLFQENINLFYSQPFIGGISYEYGLFNKIKNTKMAFDIYKNAADFKYDSEDQNTMISYVDETEGTKLSYDYKLGYDESGKMISIIYVSDAGVEENHTEFTYNDKGLIVSSARYGKENQLLVYTEYTYE